MVNILQLYKDFNITYWTEGNNVQQGWVNITCPFCNDKSNHLGFNLSKQYYNCWNCGHHDTYEVLQNILSLNYSQVKDLLEEYKTNFINTTNKKSKPVINKIEMPGEELLPMHKKYLIKRGFDPDYLVDKYKIKGTGILGDWRFRIMIPVFYENKLVTYQGRDITDIADLRYRNLSEQDSIISIKNILYNFDNLQQFSTIIGIGEGVFDVWRMGDGFTCTFSTSVTPLQIRLLSQFKRIFFLFDSEVEAQKRAKKVASKLSALGCVTEVIDIGTGKDLAELKEDDVRYIRKELGF